MFDTDHNLTTQLPVELKEQYKDDTFNVSFDGKEYIAVMPTPLSNDFSKHFDDKDSAWRWAFKIHHEHACGYWWNIADKKACAQVLWSDFGDTPINDDDEIDENFLDFEKGTDRFEIWSWFEETFDICLAKECLPSN